MDVANAFPPSYAAATGQHSALCGELNFMDFVPRCLDPGGLFAKAVFEPFNVLVDRANAWLRQTPNWEAKTCESVEFKNRSNEISYEKMTYLDYGQYYTYYIRGLRLWIVPRHDPSRPPQQIGYVNVVPQRLQHGGLETLDTVLDRFNKVLQSRPIPGRILTVETQEMKMPSTSAFDPDKSLWVEKGEYSHQFVFVIRVFYEVSAPANEVIGIASFVPRALKEGGLFSDPVFEPFSNVIRNAFQWCSQQTGIRFCNAQSVEIKMKSGYIIDTQRMMYTEHGKRRTYYVRILRLAYTKSLPNTVGYMPSNVPVLNLTCKTFVPVQVMNRIFQVSEFENLSMTKQRIVAWVKATGARVVSAETCAVRLFGGDCAGHDSSFTYTTGEHGEHWIFIIRLYLDGFYSEPPEELLPPMPTQNNESCLVM